MNKRNCCSVCPWLREDLFVCWREAPWRTCEDKNQVRPAARYSSPVERWHPAGFSVQRSTQSQICCWSSRFCSLNQNAAPIVLWSLISRRAELLSKPAADYRPSVCVCVPEGEHVCLWVWLSLFVPFTSLFCQEALRAVVRLVCVLVSVCMSESHHHENNLGAVRDLHTHCWVRTLLA